MSSSRRRHAASLDWAPPNPACTGPARADVGDVAVEPRIGAYRRAVCGDLTSAFNFRSPNHEPLPTLAGHTTKSQVTR